MQCKFCLAELADDATVCPLCGKDLTETEETPVEETVEEIAEETPSEETAEAAPAKKKIKPWVILLVAVGGVVLAAALTLAVLFGMGVKPKSVSAFFGFTKADIFYKNNYSVSDKKMEKNANTVIAKIGDQTLTNEQLQVYYWMAVREYVNQYNYALSMGQAVELDFDPAQPLHKQTYDLKTGESWQQFFLKNALSQWQNYATVVQLSKDAGYVLPQEIQDWLNTYDEEMTATALEAGLADVETLIDQRISKGSSAAAHYHSFVLEYTALGYLDTRNQEFRPTEQEIEDYYKAHEAEMKAMGAGKDAGKYYDVRHILIAINGTMGQLEDGTYGYTAEQWEECRSRAQKMLDDFLADAPTEEKFAALAKEYSEDPGSASNGGLYSYLTKDTGFIPEFKDWYMDETRKPGDTGLVKNTGSSKMGYHIMYFSNSMDIWRDEAETQVVNEKMTKLLEEATAKYPMTVNYKKVVLGQADLSAQQ